VFVTLEGIDRSGKTTQAALLAEALGRETLLLREPGGTEVGERIRKVLKDPATELDPRAELLLFCAARAELCARVIRPALDDGHDVVCDRFIDSTVAYQGAARGLGVEAIRALNEFGTGGLKPDRTLLLRVEPATARERISDRTADRLEREDPAFFAAIAAAYDALAAAEPERFAIIDAAQPPDAVLAAALQSL